MMQISESLHLLSVLLLHSGYYFKGSDLGIMKINRECSWHNAKLISL
jgi:hypothetical protein